MEKEMDKEKERDTDKDKEKETEPDGVCLFPLPARAGEGCALFF